MRQHLQKMLILMLVVYPYLTFAQEIALIEQEEITIPNQAQNGKDISVVILNAKDAKIAQISDVLLFELAGYKDTTIAGPETFANEKKAKACLKIKDCIRKHAADLKFKWVMYGTASQKKNKPNVISLSLTLQNVKDGTIAQEWQEEYQSDSLGTVTKKISNDIRKIMKPQPEEMPPELAALTTEEEQFVGPPEPSDLNIQNLTVIPPTKLDFNWSPWVGATLVGIGIGLAAGGTYYGIQYNVAQSNYQSTNIQREAYQYHADSQSSARTANILFATGGAAFAAGATVFILDQFDIFHKTPQTIIVPNPSGATLNLSF